MNEEMMDYLVDRIATLSARRTEHTEQRNYLLAAAQSLVINELQGFLDKFTTV